MEEELKKEATKEAVTIEKVEETEAKILEVVNTGGKGYSISALVLGIVSIVFVYSWFLTVPCGILAIIFGINGKKRDGKGMAKAGFILGIIGLSLWLLGLLFFGALIGLGMSAFLSI